MERIDLKATIRKDFGKSGSRHLRKTGQIPAVIYKSGEQGVNVQVDNKDLWKVLHTEAGSNVIINMNIFEKKKHLQKTVIVQEIQIDPVNDKVMHVDFHEISLKEKLKVKVPVIAKGEAVGVKEEEGVLTQAIWEVEIECLPTAIPEHIDVHVDNLHIGDVIHIKEVEFPKDVEVLEDPEQVVVSVIMPKEEVIEEEEAPAEELEEPEVIKKGKKEEEPGEEEEEPSAEKPQKKADRKGGKEPASSGE